MAEPGVSRAISLSVRCVRTPASVILELRGQLDLVGAERLADEVETVLCSGPVEAVVIDIKELEFVDLLGVRALSDGCRRLGSAGADVRVEHLSRQTKRVLDLSGIDLPVGPDGKEPSGQMSGASERGRADRPVLGSG